MNWDLATCSFAVIHPNATIGISGGGQDENGNTKTVFLFGTHTTDVTGLCFPIYSFIHVLDRIENEHAITIEWKVEDAAERDIKAYGLEFLGAVK